MGNLKELIRGGVVYPAWLPEKNDFIFNEKGKRQREEIIKRGMSKGLPTDMKYLDLDSLDELKGYFVFLTEKDYSALSPLMWNSLFESRNLNFRAVYCVGNPKDAQTIVRGLKSDSKYLGGGFGSGWKEQYKYLDKIFPEGLVSVNNIVKDKVSGNLIGYNTDIPGFLLPLERKLMETRGHGLENKVVVMFGGGGVGKQLVRGLLDKNVGKLYIINRTVEKAKQMAEDANRIIPDVAEFGGEDRIRDFLLRENVVAAINVSKKGAEPLQDYSAFAFADVSNVEGVKDNNDESLEIVGELARKNKEIVLYDITLPRSGFPKTLQIAKQVGLKNLLDGKGMFVNQGIIAIQNVEKLNSGIFGEKLSEKEIEDIFSVSMRND